MEIREDNENEESTISIISNEVMERNELTTEIYEEISEETEETRETTGEGTEETTGTTETIIVSADSNYLDDNLNDLTFNSLALCVVILLLGILSIGGFRYDY